MEAAGCMTRIAATTSCQSSFGRDGARSRAPDTLRTRTLRAGTRSAGSKSFRGPGLDVECVTSASTVVGAEALSVTSGDPANSRDASWSRNVNNRVATEWTDGQGDRLLRRTDAVQCSRPRRTPRPRNVSPRNLPGSGQRRSAGCADSRGIAEGRRLDDRRTDVRRRASEGCHQCAAVASPWRKSTRARRP